MITYRYAYNTKNMVTDVLDLTERDRGDFTCVGCGEPLVLVLPFQKTRHFRHKYTGQVTCSPETALHNLAKRVLWDLAQTELWLEFGNVSINMAQLFNEQHLETQHNGFRPDILLLHSDFERVAYLEIAVTHRCERPKIESGTWIIEVPITCEQDIAEIRHHQALHSGNSATYNLRSIYGFEKRIEQYLYILDELESFTDGLPVWYPSKMNALLELGLLADGGGIDWNRGNFLLLNYEQIKANAIAMSL